mgnify:CR=1 FL=1
MAFCFLRHAEFHKVQCSGAVHGSLVRRRGCAQCLVERPDRFVILAKHEERTSLEIAIVLVVRVQVARPSERYRCFAIVVGPQENQSQRFPRRRLGRRQAWSRVAETAVHRAAAPRGSRSSPDSSSHRGRRAYGSVSPKALGQRLQTCRFRGPKPQSADPERQADQSDQSRPRGAYGQKHNITVDASLLDLERGFELQIPFQLAYGTSSIYTFSQAFFALMGSDSFSEEGTTMQKIAVCILGALLFLPAAWPQASSSTVRKRFATSIKPWCRTRPSR